MSLHTIQVNRRRLGDYAGVLTPDLTQQIRTLAGDLTGLRILHLSAGPFGSVVSETLAGLVPLQRNLGLTVDWQVLHDLTPNWQSVYQGLAGGLARWGRRERTAWYTDAARYASKIAAGYDVIVAHDPQVVPIALAFSEKAAGPQWVWHNHLDLRGADPELWQDLRHALTRYQAAIFPHADLIPDDCGVDDTLVAPPVIDPGAPKNLPLPGQFSTSFLHRLRIDPERPLIGCFAPIDRRYAPIAALGAYWLARREIPRLQIVLVDFSLSGSRRQSRDLEALQEAAAGDHNIHLLTPLDLLGPTALNALERAVSAVLQPAVPAGFGWGVAECQWKGKPAIVGRHGLLPTQVTPGDNGFLVEGAPDAAEAIVRLVRDPELAAELGRHGRERIRRDHLLPGLALRYLQLLRGLQSGRPAVHRESSPSTPVVAQLVP